MFKKNKKIVKMYNEMSTLELFRLWLITRLPRYKHKVSRDQNSLTMAPPPPPDITHVAIVLDGIVEDVMMCQNRLAALLLSQPIFVEFDPEKGKPQIGLSEYKNKKFSHLKAKPLAKEKKEKS